MSGEKGKRGMGARGLFKDRRVQLFLGKFLSGELTKITPVFDPKTGYRYPDVEAFVDDPGDSEIFLRNLEGHGLLTRETCGLLLSCPKCGSPNVDKASSTPGAKELGGQHAGEPVSTGGDSESIEVFLKGGGLVCRSCGASLEDLGANLRRVYRYNFSEKGIDRISDRLVVMPVREFLAERGYKTISPGALIGESEVQHPFDIIAYGVDPEQGAVVIDFHVSDSPGSEEKVIAMFAKVFDTNPHKAILVAFPGLTDKAKRLAEQYRIGVVESDDVSSLFKKLLKAIPPVGEIEAESLDVMTLLSLPDHLRKTATVVCSLGRATAEDISERTNRARAVESGYLNQLVRMGYLNKERRGRKVIFSIST